MAQTSTALSSVASKTNADITTVTPKEYTGAFSNPMCGFRGQTGQTNGYVTTLRDYIPWNAIEPDKSATAQTIIDYTNKHYSDLPAKNQRLIPRVYLIWPGKNKTNNKTYWPSDLKTNDSWSDEFLERVTALVEKMGQAWDNDPRIAYIEMGIYGYWGEHHFSHNPDGWPENLPKEVEKVLGDAFTKAFKNKKIVVAGGTSFQNYNFGYHWDSFGHPQSLSAAAGIKKRGTFWQTSIIEGEVAYDWGTYAEKLGKSPTETVSNATYRQWVIDLVRTLHTTGLGWISQYDTTDATAKAGAAEIQKAFGYRYVIDRFSYTANVGSDRELSVNMSIRNLGSAPFYYPWNLTVSLLDAKTHAVVYSANTSADITKILPGDDYDLTAHEYKTEAKPYTVSLKTKLPENLDGKSYYIAVSINDPSCNRPSVRFACENYWNGGYHPMGTVNVNGSSTIAAMTFDDIEKDKSINYAE